MATFTIWENGEYSVHDGFQHTHETEDGNVYHAQYEWGFDTIEDARQAMIVYEIGRIPLKKAETDVKALTNKLEGCKFSNQREKDTAQVFKNMVAAYKGLLREIMYQLALNLVIHKTHAERNEQSRIHINAIADMVKKETYEFANNEAQSWLVPTEQDDIPF